MLGDEQCLRLLENLVGAADLYQAPRARDADPIPQRQRLCVIVGDVDGRNLAQRFEGVELRTKLVADLGIEVTDRLIEQERFGLRHQGPAQRRPLLLPARYFGWPS